LGPIHERETVVLDSVARYPELQVQTAADSDNFEGGRRAARVLLAAHPRLTALVCVNDVMAVGALRELRDAGIRVPQDISVTGFDNIKLAQFCYPALTSVDIPRHEIGNIICDSLISRSTAISEHEMVIDPELVLRDSSGPAAR
jgi:DNA-binding LacI/PurR family transcriptional regulator